MGNYLNSAAPCHAFREAAHGPYYIDKSALLSELFPRVSTAEKYICITRPRRFGKSMAANMVAAFFSAADESDDIFAKLKVGEDERYGEYRGKYDVISISFNELPRKCTTYEQYIERIETRLIEDLMRAYPDAGIATDDSLWDAFDAVFDAYESRQFIFVFDEWDFPFHREFMSDGDRKHYMGFLGSLLKDKAYVALVYMTGILPIAKYSSGSELNMFAEYTMASEELYGEYFGFVESETDELYRRYLLRQRSPHVTREGLRDWYDGYHTKSGNRVYNPRSVVLALTNNNLGNYWTSSGPYDEIYYYVSHNVDAVRDDLALLSAGIPVPTKICEYAAASMNLTTRNEIFSAMVVYGFLSYENGCVCIPNRELMDRFDDMLE